MLPITGYTDRLSVAPGERLEFKVSAVEPGEYAARLVRVICGDVNPAGPGLREEELASSFNATYRARNQPVNLGSYAVVEDHPVFSNLHSFGLRALIWPTTPDKPGQGVITRVSPQGAGFALLLDGIHGLSIVIGEHSGKQEKLALGKRLRSRQWYEVWAGFDATTGRLEVGQRVLEPLPAIDESGRKVVTTEVVPSQDFSAAVLLAAVGGQGVSGHFNGKLQNPQILPGPDWSEDYTEPPVASWDFSVGVDGVDIIDVTQNRLGGKLINLPGRAMMGSSWDGSEMCWRHAPEQYNAIHFHDDDLYDCGWETDFSFTVPAEMRSGVYAARIRQGDHEDMLPFFVRPKPGTRTADICFLVPTFTYVIYANHARRNTTAVYHQRVAEWGARPWTPDEHPEYGLSTYNFHTDGSGISHASRLRPMITMRSGYLSIPELPGSGIRHFPADTHILDWFETMGHDYDVVTDDDLHQYGHALIRDYPVVVTGTHPEYHTAETLDALEQYTHTGGRLMYMGGNGFYWRVAKHGQLDGVLEVRRAEGGIRAWAAEPGEYFHAFDGQYGGLWRRNNRPPQKLVGIGFSAQGLFESSYYRRKPASNNPTAAWIFEGVDDEILGDFGLCGQGAAGYELDRVDVRLGSSPDTIVLASSENHAKSFVLVPEEHLTHVTTWSGEPAATLIRADMSYFETLGGGSVFSTGSITFCGSLSHNGYDNNISRIVDNVITRFKTPR